MRDYSKVSPQFWIGATGKKLRAKGIECQLVSLYLMTCSHANMLGMYYLPKIYIAHECGLSIEGATKGLQSAIEAGFCSYDDASEVVWVHEMATYQIGDHLTEKDLRVKGVQNEYNAQPESPYLKPFFSKYSNQFLMTSERGNEAPCKPLASQEQEQEQEHKQEQEQEAGTGMVAQPENSGSDQKETELQVACRHTWASYSAAYLEKYKADPVRNAKVSSQVKDFVKRIGYEESPKVAAWFLTHTDSFYSKGGHVFGMLAKDAEKLRTEWATGNVIEIQQYKSAGQQRIENTNKAVDEFLGVSNKSNIIEGEYQHA